MPPITHAQWLAARIRHASLRIEPNEGHISIGVNAIDRMLDGLGEIRTTDA
jgi:hypothetical protein